MDVIGDVEREALLEAARLRPDPTRLRAWVDLCDPDALLRAARRHALVPALARAVRDLDVAAPIARALAEARATAAQDALRLAGELARVHRALAAADVRALAFKGPTLGVLAYDDVAARTFGDLDLWIEPDRLGRAADALADVGYLPAPGARRLVAAVRDGARPMPTDVTFGCDARRVALDVHLRLVRAPVGDVFTFGACFARRQEVRVAGTPIPTFGREDLALYLALHGAKHGWEALGWLRDLAALVDRRPPDGDALRRRACRAGLSRVLHVGLRLARDPLGASLPPALDTAVEVDRRAERAAAELMTGMFGPAWDDRPHLDRLRLELRLRERRRDRWRTLLGRPLAPESDDFAAVELPGWLFGGYRAVRLARVAGKLIRAA